MINAEQIENLQEVQIHRLISFANFLSGVKMTHPLSEGFAIKKNSTGYEILFDNFSFTWAIGLLPLVFGKHWAYSDKENIILKEQEELTTFFAIQTFFGLSIGEYFHLFVAYFQDTDNLGGKMLRHDTTTGEDMANNIRELVRRKIKVKSELN